MAIKVKCLENLFGDNGSGEKPNYPVDDSGFTEFPDLLPDGLDGKITGTIILRGEDGNYAKCEGYGYFLRRAQLLDRENNVYLYALLRDHGCNGLERGISITGFCNRTNDEELVNHNIDYVDPVIDNPCKITRINLSDSISRHWADDLGEIKLPKKQKEELRKPHINDSDWYKFLLDLESTPVATYKLSEGFTNEKPYQRGVYIVGELEVNSELAAGKGEVYDLIHQLIKRIKNKEYVLTKVNKLGQTKVKNGFALTPALQNAIGSVEEVARVTRLDFSGLRDISQADPVRGNISAVHREGKKLDINKSTLSKYSSGVDEAERQRHKKVKVLQRKVYFPYPRESGATNNNYLYRGFLDESRKASARAQSTKLASYTEEDAFIPIYQGNYAQGVKSKSNDANFGLSFCNHLNTTFNYRGEGNTINQGQGSLNNKIPFFNEVSPPEFGFLLFNYLKERKKWNGGHYQDDFPTDTLSVLIGLKKGWEKPDNNSYDRTTGKGVTEVNKGNGAFSLLNSLYPLAGIYYFTALQNNSVQLRGDSHGGDWATESGFFGYTKKYDVPVDFSSVGAINQINRNIDNKLLDLDYFDRVRLDFFSKKGIFQKIYLDNGGIQKNDIFFSDLRGYGEEYDVVDNNFKYKPEFGWYLSLQKDHRQLAKGYKSKVEAPKLVFYGNGALNRYQFGIYHTYQLEHQLAESDDNDVQQVQFRENNANTKLDTKAVEDGVTSKTIIYHHIKGIRKIEQQDIFEPNKQSFLDFARTPKGKRVLDQINHILGYIQRDYSPDATASGTCYFWGNCQVNNITPLGETLYGVKNLRRLISLPEKGTDYDLEAIYELFNVDELGEEGVNGKYCQGNLFDRANLPSGQAGYKQSAKGWGKATGGLGKTIGLIREDDFYNTVANMDAEHESDILKFNGFYTITPSSKTHSFARPLIRLIKELLTGASDLAKVYGVNYSYASADEAIKALDTEGLQKDIFRGLNLLTPEGLVQAKELDIRDKLFSLDGTGYFLGVDKDKLPHLIFSRQAVDRDIALKESKVLRIRDEDQPEQDLIDLLNQKTSIQVVTAQYPLNERIRFTKVHDTVIDIGRENLPSSTFKLEVSRFTPPNKITPQDLFIIKYEGARQLIDVKLAVPKKAIEDTRETDVVALQQLNLEQEKGREDYRARNIMLQAEKAYQQKKLQNELGEYGIENAFKIAQTAGAGFKLLGGVGKFMSTAYRNKYTVAEDIMEEGVKTGTKQVFTPPTYRKYNYLGKGYGKLMTAMSGKGQLGNFVKGNAINFALQGLQRVTHANKELGMLNVKAAGIEADIEHTIAELTHQSYELKREHDFQQRAFAQQLLTIGNIYEQGEINDRDINDEYNDKYGLNEIHLIYRTPSPIQKEAIRRYHNQFGYDCQIPDVTLKIIKGIAVGQIGHFSSITKIDNLFKIEEKELLKAILANGIKIIQNTSTGSIPLLPTSLTGEEKIGLLINEATPQQKSLVFSKLRGAMDQATLIKQLAEELPDRSKVFELLIPYLDKQKLTTNVLMRANKDDKENIIKELADSIDHTEVLNYLIGKEDKEKLVEKGIDEGTNFKDLLGDKYTEHTLSRDEHKQAIQIKDDQLAGREKQLKDMNIKLTSAEESVNNLEDTLNKAQQRIISLNKDAVQGKKDKKGIESELSNTKEKLRTTTLEQEKTKKQIDQIKDDKEQLNKQVKEFGDLNRDLLEKKGNLEKQNEELSAKLSEFSQYRAQRDELMDEVKDLKKKLFDTEQSLAAVREIEANLKNVATDTTFNKLTRYLKIPLLNLTHSSYSSQRAPYQVVDYYGSLKIVYFDETKFCYIIDDSLALGVYNSYKLLTLSKGNPNSNGHSYYLNNGPSYFGHKISSTTDFKNKVGSSNIEYRSGRANSFDFLGPVPVHWGMLAGYGNNHPFFFSYEPTSDESNLSVYSYTNSKLSGYTRNSSSEYNIPLNTYGRYLAYFGLWYDGNQQGYEPKLKVLTKSKAKEVYSKIEGLDVDYILETYFS